MAPRPPRRYIRLDDGELDDVARMCAEKQKELEVSQIMRVKRDTKEAEIASQNKTELSNWSSFHTTIEVPHLPGGEARDLHSHRSRIRQGLREDAATLGLNSIGELSLEDIYDHPGGGRPGRKRFPSGGKFSKAPVPPPTKQLATISLFQPKGTPRGRRGKPYQTRPWPPAALLGAPGVAPVTTGYVATAKSSTQKMTDRSAGGQLAADAGPVKTKAPDVLQPWASNLATPMDFMSAVTSQLSQKLDQPNQQSGALNSNGCQDVPNTSSAEAAQKDSTAEPEDAAIRRVPVQEFSFPALGALAPGEIGSHTDGARTPGTLSGFSTFTETLGKASVQPEAQTSDLIGLGIDCVDFDNAPAVLEVRTSLTAPEKVVGLSPTGSIMDSPILDDVKSEVLAARPGDILEVAGRKYIAIEDLLALRDAIDKKINAGRARDNSGLTPPSEPAAVASTQPSSAPSTTTSSDASTAIPAARANPFAPREPMVINNATASPTPAPVAETKKSNAAVEPVRPSATIRPAPLSSNTQIFSKWASEPQSPPAPRRDTNPVRQHSSIIGDHKAFGQLSQGPRKGQQYTPPPTKPASKQKPYIQPGAGYAWLLQELAAKQADEESK